MLTESFARQVHVGSLRLVQRDNLGEVPGYLPNISSKTLPTVPRMLATPAIFSILSASFEQQYSSATCQVFSREYYLEELIQRKVIDSPLCLVICRLSQHLSPKAVCHKEHRVLWIHPSCFECVPYDCFQVPVEFGGKTVEGVMVERNTQATRPARYRFIVSEGLRLARPCGLKGESSVVAANAATCKATQHPELVSVFHL